jgi:predicted dehydrogenase
VSADEDYGLGKPTALREIPAPELTYKPRNPRHYNPPIGLIGCGGIAQHHLAAYRKAGFNVVALCDLGESRAVALRDKFYPEAKVFTDHGGLLGRGDIEVVDVATHPHQRLAILDEALEAGKHVLSQKPFVLDLDAGERLVGKADRLGVKLAVNQNGRWAPHFSYMRHVIQAGLIGEVASVSFTLNWDHTWIAGTEFEKVHHIILYDFAIHWFDIATMFFPGRTAERVFAAATRVPGQTIKPPMIAKALVEFDGGLANFSFNGLSPYGQSDRTTIIGSRGTLQSAGPDLSNQQVTLFKAEGFSKPALEGTWFPDGFHGTMAELLCAVEEKREPSNSARNNLKSLALAFAAMASADCGEPKRPGEVRRPG